MKVAFFCRNPLGDGVNSLVLSQNFFSHGHQIDTYHNTLGMMQGWLPHLPIFRYPEIEEVSRLLDKYDLLIAVWDGKTEFIARLVEEGKRRFPDKVKVIYLYSSKNIVHEPYYSDCLVDPSKSVAENFWLFCERMLGPSKKEICWSVPKGLKLRKHIHRVVLHPTGSGPMAGSWPKEKFLELAHDLRRRGYEVVLIPGWRDMEAWSDAPFERVDFATLDGLARYLYESGYLVGSDSGPGHFASALGIPTVTICRRKTHAKLWSPDFALNETVTPATWIPNVRWFRLRDRHWKKWISWGKVKRGFGRLLEKEHKVLL